MTWHGKGNEDKRGRSVGEGVLAHSWLYVAGKPVVCTRVMELAALVSSINPTLTPTIDVHEVAQMQHKLLWLLYEGGKHYQYSTVEIKIIILSHFIPNYLIRHLI